MSTFEKQKSEPALYVYENSYRGYKQSGLGNLSALNTKKSKFNNVLNFILLYMYV